MGIWISSQASDLFAVSLANTGSGLAGYALFRGGMTVSFPQGVLNSAASLVPKLTYLIGYFVGILGASGGLGDAFAASHYFSQYRLS